MKYTLVPQFCMNNINKTFPKRIIKRWVYYFYTDIFLRNEMIEIDSLASAFNKFQSFIESGTTDLLNNSNLHLGIK